MRKIFDRISNIGTSSLALESDRRNVFMTNRIVTIAFALNFILFAMNLSRDGWSFMTWAVLIGNLLAYPAVLSMNHFGHNVVSRLLLSLMFSVYPFVASLRSKMLNAEGIEEAMYFAPRLFVMITAIVPMLLFSNREWRILLPALAGSFIPLLFFDPIHRYFEVGYYQMGFDYSGYPVFVAISIVSYLMFLSATFFFKRLNEKYETQNLQLISSLQKKTHEVELQAEEIRIVNQNLEAAVDHRTKQVLDQALKFQKFSYKNSHELRAPLAKVMGTINLLKTTDTPDERKILLKMLDESCQELDVIVHEINEIVSSETIE